MSFYRKWRPSKAAAREFAAAMDEIAEYCRENGISQSASGDSYYFSVGDVHYRVSNHTVAASNRGAYRRDELTGQTERVRALYHADGEDGMICITAGKTRIREIHQALLRGEKLDRRGNPVGKPGR